MSKEQRKKNKEKMDKGRGERFMRVDI